jgi:RNA polymerase sigma-70 factor (family 1)
MSLSDDQIIKALHQGDGRAFNEVFDKYYKALCYFTSRLISNREEAEDIVLITFSKFWQMRANFETLVNIKAFLYITGRNNCLDYLRYKQRQADFEKAYAYLLENDKEENPLKIETEVLRKIYAAIENLPLRCRKVFKLTYFQGLNANEIAEKLSISVSTVTSQRSRAIKLLRLDLGEYIGLGLV